jgi:hypothetical protein
MNIFTKLGVQLGSGFAGLVRTVALGTTAEVTLVPFMNAIAAEAGAG